MFVDFFVCLFVCFIYKNIDSFDFPFRVWVREKEITPPSRHFHGLYSLDQSAQKKSLSCLRNNIVNHHFSS